MSKPALAIVAVALLLARPALALNPGRTLTQAQHRIWQVGQGLPQASIYAAVQTRDGYLWLGTQAGLVRFDGVRFDVAAGIGDGVWVRGVAESPDGTLWMATDHGVRRLRGRDAAAFTTVDGLPGDAVRCVAVGADGTVWAGTTQGLARFEGKRWAASGPAVDVRAVATAGGAVWFSDGTQLRAVDGRTFDVGGTVTAIAAAGDGTVWAGTDRGLVRCNGASQHRFTVADGLAADAVTCLSPSAVDGLWVGTRDGLCRCRDGRFDRFRAADGLSQSTVFCLTEDREGSLWVGTKHGLNQLLDRRAVPFTESEGLADNVAGPVICDGGGTIWAGSRAAGLTRFDGTRFGRPVTLADGLASNRIAAVALADGGLWVGSDRGLNRLRDGRVVVSPAVVPPLVDVTCICPDRNDLWVGTAASAVLVRGGRATAVHVGAVRAICRWRDHSVLATAAGLTSVDPSGAERPVDPSADVDCLYPDAAGYLWAGTRGDGLRIIDPAGRAIGVTPADGLFDDDLYGIVEDDAGRLWMACSKGVFWVARADLLSFAAGRSQRVRCTPFSSTDSQRTVEGRPDVQPAAWRARDGRLWFATIHGLLVFDPADVTARPAPAAAVEDVGVDGRWAAPGDVGTLPPGVRNLTFRYTARTLLAPAVARFRYQLEGFDKEPVDAGTRREAHYTNLPPGRYRFRVTAALPDGPAGAAGVVELELSPRLDQRAWFWPAVAAVAIAGVWAAYRGRVRRIRDRIRVRHAATSAERARIARELHDTLLQGFSGITMEMQAFSARLANPADRAALADIVRDAAACMTDARRSVAGLRAGTAPLPDVLASVSRQLTESSDLRLHLRLADGAGGASPEADYHLVRIAHEAIGNAVRHASASTVRVTLAAGDGGLQLAVTDDGRGFDAAARPPAGHFGLIGMRERAAQIGGDLLVESRPGGGTTVTVTVPTAPS